VPAMDEAAFTADDQKLLGSAHDLLEQVRAHMDAQAFHEALETVWLVIRAANAYVDHQAPWKLRKEDPVRMEQVLYTLAEVIRHVALILQPYMPESCGRMLDQLSIAPEHRSFEASGPAQALKSGTELPKPEGVFPRLVEDAENNEDNG